MGDLSNMQDWGVSQTQLIPCWQFKSSGWTFLIQITGKGSYVVAKYKDSCETGKCRRYMRGKFRLYRVAKVQPCMISAGQTHHPVAVPVLYAWLLIPKSTAGLSGSDYIILAYS